MTFAPAHCVLHLDMRQSLRTNSAFMFQDKDPVARFTTHINFSDPSNLVQDT